MGGTDRNEIREGFFWAKIAAFVPVAPLSIVPTIQIIRWRRALTAEAAVLPAAPDIAGVRRFLWAEVVFFAFIPAFAAAMVAPSRAEGGSITNLFLDALNCAQLLRTPS